MEWETTEVTFDFLIAANYFRQPIEDAEDVISTAFTLDWWNANFIGNPTIAELKRVITAQGLWSDLLQERFFAINPGNFDVPEYWKTIFVFNSQGQVVFNTGYLQAFPASAVTLNALMTVEWYNLFIAPYNPMTLDAYWQRVVADGAENTPWYYRLRAIYNPYF